MYDSQVYIKKLTDWITHKNEHEFSLEKDRLATIGCRTCNCMNAKPSCKSDRVSVQENMGFENFDRRPPKKFD